MKQISVWFVAGCSLFSVSALATEVPASIPRTKVVYGEDDRRDLHEVGDAFLRQQIESTATFSIRGLINPLPNGDFAIERAPLGRSLDLCPGTRYEDQPSIGACSATLVSPRHLLTAGHCMPTQERCEEIYLLFGFHVRQAGVYDRVAPAREVYRCKKLVVRSQTSKQDFALIELDREVTDRKPVTLGTSETVRKGERVRMIGYPDGIPSKLVSGAPVRKANDQMFVAGLDAFKGNSGSSVYSETSGAMVGILFGGDVDYIYNNARGCRELNVHSENRGRGEDVTQLSGIWPQLRPHLEGLATVF